MEALVSLMYVDAQHHTPHPRPGVIRRLLACVGFLWLTMVHGQSPGPAFSAITNTPRANLHLADFRRLVLERNETIQMQLLESEVSQRLARAEKGIFDPVAVGGVDYIDNQRPNTRLDAAQLGLFASSVFLEQNTLYNAGIENLLGTGTKVRTGYVLRQLNNNIGAPQNNRDLLVGNQYSTFLGVNLTQPLLKNFGPTATLAKIRLAAMASQIAFQQYRRQTLLVLATAEAAYWDLYLAQEQVRLGARSVAIAERILADKQDRFTVGKVPQLEVLEAKAGVAFRSSRLDQSTQGAFDSASRLSGLYSQALDPTQPLPRAVDTPDLIEDPRSVLDNYSDAFAKNPDYLISQQRVEQEGLRVAYTRNQRLPQLDLKGSFGLNGLAGGPGDSLTQSANGEYPAWSVGLELRMPLGNTKERNDLAAARLSKIRAITGLKESETQVYNGIQGALRKIQLHRAGLTNASSVIEYQKTLLDAEMERLDVGGVDARTILETEERLFQAEVALVENRVMERKAWVELEVIRGTLLESRGAEVTAATVRQKTESQVLKSLPPAQMTDPKLREKALESLLKTATPTP